MHTFVTAQRGTHCTAIAKSIYIRNRPHKATTGKMNTAIFPSERPSSWKCIVSREGGKANNYSGQT